MKITDIQTINGKIGGDGETHYFIPQPKLEVDSWDEVVKEFIKHIQFDKVESQTIEFINWIKQLYTLIKKAKNIKL